jgi:hypothetical protein
MNRPTQVLERDTTVSGDDYVEEQEGDKLVRYTRGPSLLKLVWPAQEPDLLETSAAGSLTSYSPTVGAPFNQKTVFMGDLADPTVALLLSLPVEVEFWPEHVSAYSHDLELFTAADDLPTALSEMRASIVELYFTLKEEKDHLGVLPQARWDFLSHIIKEI